MPFANAMNPGCNCGCGPSSPVYIGNIPDCLCRDIPADLTMTSADETCNFSMFRTCSIVYGPTPPEFDSLNLGVNSFISAESFPDPAAGDCPFRYFLNCQFNQFTLTRIYTISPYGSPYRDGVLYTWLIGGIGNTCKPFMLTNGLAYPGSDSTCSVTITS